MQSNLALCPSKLSQPLFAESPIMTNFMDNRAPHLFANRLFVMTGIGFNWTLVDSDAVWRDIGQKENDVFLREYPRP